jgi:protein-tyrosine phosphatase
MIDFHNHVVPGVDDGAADLEQSRTALSAFREQGATAVVATPHARASVTEKPGGLDAFLASVEPARAALEEMARAEFPGLRLERGFEVMLDVPSPDLSDPRLRLAGTRFVLVEFPFMTVPPNAEQALFAVKMAGWTPVLAHPERYPGVAAAPELAEGWRRVGTLLQVNAGSLLGKYGPEAFQAARALLRRGLASYVASDYHARGTLHVAPFRAALEARGAGELAGLLLDENPGRILHDEPPLPVPPLPERERRSFFGRIFRRG